MTETATTAIVPTAIDVNRLIPRVTRPPSEMTTAIPLKNTARPAVELDVSMASGIVAAAPLGPEAGDHEQGVVDRHGEAHQHDQLVVRADRADGLAVEREEVRGRQRGDCEQQRDHRRDDRAERDEQDQERHRDRETGGSRRAPR